MGLPLSLDGLHERRIVEHETLSTWTACGIIGTPMERKKIPVYSVNLVLVASFSMHTFDQCAVDV